MSSIANELSVDNGVTPWRGDIATHRCETVSASAIDSLAVPKQKLMLLWQLRTPIQEVVFPTKLS